MPPADRHPQPDRDTLVLRPSKLAMCGRTHLFQIPDNPKGTVAMLHGCARSATGFWPFDPHHAPDCTGFPEDVSHVQQALRMGYAVLVPDPQDTKTMCWSSRDMDDVLAIIDAFLTKHALKKKPLYVLGASSGGGLCMRLPKHLAYRKANFGIDGIINEVSTNTRPEDVLTPKYPSVVWVVMERDTGSQEEARQYVRTVAKQGVEAGMAIAPTRKITPTHFHDRIQGITPAQSRQIVEGMKSIKMLDAEGGLRDNPKDHDKPGSPLARWPGRLKHEVPIMSDTSKTLNLIFRKSPIWQALLAAWSQHEHVADYTTAALKWFEAGCKGPFKEFADKYA